MFTGMNYINGNYTEYRQDFPSLNPENDEVIGNFPNSRKEEVLKAVSSARSAFPYWKSKSRIARGDLFDKLAQLIKSNTLNLVNAISLETGKNKNESLAEVNEALHMCQYTASMGRIPCGEVIASELPEKDAYVLRKPKGVVAVISPWNFPLAIGGFWSTAPALLEGNTVVWKPSEETPMCAQLVVDLYHQAGFPIGVLNLVHGNEIAGDALVKADVDCILFTGSPEVGMLIRKHCAETWHKTCACEMGSKSAVIVFEDAWTNKDMVLDACIASSFKLSGQRCVSAGRHIVQRSIFDDFCNEFVDRANKLKFIGSIDERYYGPLINKSQVERVCHYNELVRNDPEAVVLLNGSNVEGNFMSPFVYRTEWRDVPYLKEEVFGPHIGLIPFDNTDDAIRIYNDTEYGLSMAVCTNDFRTARRFRNECDFGLGYVNGSCVGAESHLPFTGLKKSGSNYGSARGTFDAVVHKVAWTVNHGDEIRFAQGMTK